MRNECLNISRQAGRHYRLRNPESTLADAQREARRLWPTEPHIGLDRAFFLCGWAQAGLELSCKKRA
jgi:hypothetical protein